MAFTFGDSDFSSIFGTPGPMGASPSMGRLLQTNPEAIIPALIAAGVEPPMDQPAEPEGQLHSAPPIPMLPGAEAPAAPSTTPSLVPPSIPMAGQPMPPLPQFSGPPPVAQEPRMGDLFSYEPGQAPSLSRFLGGLLGGGPATAQPAAPTEPMAPGGGSPSDYYESPPSEQPAPGTPLPPPRPTLADTTGGKGGKGAGGSKAAAKPASDALKGLTDALSGVKAPPAPPTPQLRPETARAGSAQQQNSPLIALLTGLLAGRSGGQAAGSPYRLSQAVGGKVV